MQASFGDANTLATSVREQYTAYVNRYGPGERRSSERACATCVNLCKLRFSWSSGMIIFWFGFVRPELELNGVIIRDVRAGRPNDHQQTRFFFLPFFLAIPATTRHHHARRVIVGRRCAVGRRAAFFIGGRPSASMVGAKLLLAGLDGDCESILFDRQRAATARKHDRRAPTSRTFLLPRAIRREHARRIVGLIKVNDDVAIWFDLAHRSNRDSQRAQTKCNLCRAACSRACVRRRRSACRWWRRPAR